MTHKPNYEEGETPKSALEKLKTLGSLPNYEEELRKLKEMAKQAIEIKSQNYTDNLVIFGAIDKKHHSEVKRLVGEEMNELLEWYSEQIATDHTTETHKGENYRKGYQVACDEHTAKMASLKKKVKGMKLIYTYLALGPVHEELEKEFESWKKDVLALFNNQ